MGSHLRVDGAFRHGNNTSQQTQNSVVVVDHYEDENGGQESNSGLRLSTVSNNHGLAAKGMKLNTGFSKVNVTGDTIFKQNNSTSSIHGGQRSTQNTAYTVRTTSSGRQKGKLGTGSHMQTS